MQATTIISHDLGCAWRWSDKYNQLEWAPLSTDGTYDFENEGGCVDEDIVGGEVVTFRGKEMTLSEVYRIVESELGI